MSISEVTTDQPANYDRRRGWPTMKRQWATMNYDEQICSGLDFFLNNLGALRRI